MKTLKRVTVVLLALAMAFQVNIVGNVVETKADGYGISNPKTQNDITTWDCVYFGSYNQMYEDEERESFTKEPIKWRVLSVNGNDAFLLSEKILGNEPYNDEREDVTWKTSTIRQWLNDDFYNSAFDATEKNAIEKTSVVNSDNGDTPGGENTQDNVFLLSLDEVKNANYGFFDSPFDGQTSTRMAKVTDYAGEVYGYEGFGDWWLRSPGYESNCAAMVFYLGNVYDDGADVDTVNNLGVRPAIHLDLSKDVWQKAGTVTGGNTSGINHEVFFSFNESSGLLEFSLRDGFDSGNISREQFGFKDDIKTVKVGEGITSIDDGNFYYCENLLAVYLPSTIENIESSSFNGCDSLKDVYFNGTKEEWSQVYVSEYSYIRKATIHCSNGDVIYEQEEEVDYSLKNVVKLEFFNVRDIFAGFDYSVLNGIGAYVTMDDGKKFYFDLGYEIGNYESTYNGVPTLNFIWDILETEAFKFTISDDAYTYDEETGDRIIGKTGKIKVNITQDRTYYDYDIQYNNQIEVNSVENPVKKIDVKNTRPRKISLSDLKNNGDVIERNDIVAEYTNGVKDWLDFGDEHSGFAYDDNEQSCSVFFFDENIYNRNSVPEFLKIHTEKRHKVNYKLDTKIRKMEVGMTYPMTIEYMGREVVTYILVTENETEYFDLDSSGGDEETTKPVETNSNDSRKKDSTNSNKSATVVNNKKVPIKKIVAKKKSLKLSWKKVNGVSGYQIQYGTKKNFKKAKMITVKKAAVRSITIKSLKRKKKYYIRIRTFIVSKGKKVSSPWSKAKVKKTK